MQQNLGTPCYQNRYTKKKKVGWRGGSENTDQLIFCMSVVFLIHRTVQWPTILPVKV